MIDLTTSDTAPDNFFDDGDWVWVDAALPPLTRQQKSFIPSVLDKILTEANFNKKQVDVINEYWKKTTSTTMEDEVILCAAYRAGLYSYSTEHIEEHYLLHACKYIVKFLGNGDGDGDGSEEFQFEGEIKHFRLVVKEAEWLLVADVVTEEVYSRIIMRMLTENDLEGLIESVLGGEVGLLDESFFSNLNDIGDVVVGRLMGLDCAIYSELEKKYDDDADLIAFSVDEEGKDKDDTNSDAMMIKIKKENEAKMKLDEERVAHDDNGGDNGGDDGYLAAIEEKKIKCDTGVFESTQNALSSLKLNESVLEMSRQSNKNNKNNKNKRVGAEITKVFIPTVLEIVMRSITIACKMMFVGKGMSNRGKSDRRTSRRGSRNVLYQTNIAARFIHSLLVFLAASSDLFVDSAADDFAWTDGDPDDYDYKNYCDAGGVNNARMSCVCINDKDNSFIKPSAGDGSSGYSYYVCSRKCGGYPFKAEGFCAQCAAGSFFGRFYTIDEQYCPGIYCPENYSYCTKANPFSATSCQCRIDTYSKGIALTKYRFDYVCSNDADNYQLNGEDYYDYKVHCHECPAGTFSNQGDMVCSTCPKGTFTNSTGSPQCKQCPTGTYTDTTGTTECTPCPAGSFNDNEGSKVPSDCKKCSPGYYSSSPGSPTCNVCGVGEYSEMGATECSIADPGYYVGATNQFEPHTAQYPCPVGSYTETAGQHYCISCPDGSSTTGTASTSSTDCTECKYGVDSTTLACLTESEAANLNDLCWDVSQLLSLNASSTVYDLFNLVYNLKDVGMNALINDAMSIIQGAAEGTASIEDIQNVLSRLENGRKNWLDGVSSNMTSCVDAVSQELYDQAQSDLFANTNIFQYQFGDNYAQERTEWIANWKCSGGTFGCTPFSNPSNCPQATTCFSRLHQYFAPTLSYAGGTPFGNYPYLITGRYTPMYSPGFIGDQLVRNVQSLVDWENTARSYQQYYGVIEQIRASEEGTKTFIANAIDVTLQINNVSTSVSLESSYTQGSLYYEQSQHNYNKTFAAAQIVQYGPAFCPSGYEITADGIPPQCTAYDALVQNCQREIKFNAWMNLIQATMSIATILVRPLPKEFNPINRRILISSSFQAIGLLRTSSGILFSKTSVVPWNPNTELPPPPPLNADGAFENQTYADESYVWYLGAQSNISESLITMSTARWDSIYLENEKQIAPTILNPPNCPNWKSKIVTALTVYLANVKDMSNYGNAMTTATMDLVPTLGNIAVGIATQAAIANANKEINGMLHPSSPNLVTAPTTYQSVYQEIFYSKYPETSNAVLAYSPAFSLAQQQYTASKGIFGFCTSYSYMNAGLHYNDENTANCQPKSFGSLYLPTFATFQDTVSYFVKGTNSTIMSPPPAVHQLNTRMVGFAANIQNEPTAFGQTRQEVSTSVETFSIEFSFGANSSSANYYGDLESGKLRFTLSPSSNLLFQSTQPFGITWPNPRVINIQAYWRGVTSSSGRFVTTTITPASPYMLYPDDSGVGTPYNLPPYNTSSGNVAFATFDSIQVQNGCASTGQTLISGSDQPKWIDGNNVDFCTPYSSSLREPFLGLSNYAFLFPAAFTQWEIETDYDVWGSNPNFAVDNETLALQVVFQYVPSSTSQKVGSDRCMLNCFPELVLRPGVINQTPLPNAQWCDRTNCNDCLAYQQFNGTRFTDEPFCLCNVWNGNYETCTSNVATSSIYSVTLRTPPQRFLLQQKSAKSDKNNDVTGTKSGKSMSDEEMAMALQLEGVLLPHLLNCNGDTNQPFRLISSEGVVEVKKCDKRKQEMTCTFRVEAPMYGDGTAEMHDCIDATLKNDTVLQDISQIESFCEIIVSRDDPDSGEFHEVSRYEYSECGENNQNFFERT